MAASNKAIIVGISGCSSSGKTTLSRLLRDIFPNTFILHEDDFYKPETELPMKHGLLDWDCADSLSLPDMIKSLEHIHQNGAFPPHLNSKEDQNSVGSCPVLDSTISALKSRVTAWTQPGQPGHILTTNTTRICILDGFLLYSPSMVSIQPHIDLKIFLRVSYAKAKARREARSGYVTLEGFWQDPPGYVDKIVWPNYVNDHVWMFENGDVEGNLKEDVVSEKGILCQDGGVDKDIEETLEWVVRLLMEKLPGLLSAR